MGCRGQAGVAALGVVTFALLMSGSAWALSGSLQGVSCHPGGPCFGVGWYYTPKATRPLAERLGSPATRQSVPSPPGSKLNQLEGVSCPSRSMCMAVGSSDSLTASPETAVADIWNGKTWSLKLPISPGTYGNSLVSVLCTNARQCTAVGSYTDQRSGGPLIERWNGSRWSLQTPAAPPTNSGTCNTDKFRSCGPFLNSVSCTSAASCMAVGTYVNKTLAESWDGSTWSNTPPTVDYSHGYKSQLRGVSCTSPSWCVAVGGGLLQLWNGTSWSRQSPRHLDMNDVSCTSPTWCVAVGQGRGPSIVTWNGQRWSPQSAQPPSDNAVFFGVSCSAQNRCVAVGNANPQDAEVPLSERWNGTRWDQATLH